MLAALDQVHTQTGAPLAAIALAWTNAQPGIAATLASATNEAQLAELVRSLGLQLTPEQLALLEQASAETALA